MATGCAKRHRTRSSLHPRRRSWGVAHHTAAIKSMAFCGRTGIHTVDKIFLLPGTCWVRAEPFIFQRGLNSVDAIPKDGFSFGERG